MISACLARPAHFHSVLYNHSWSNLQSRTRTIIPSGGLPSRAAATCCFPRKHRSTRLDSQLHLHIANIAILLPCPSSACKSAIARKPSPPNIFVDSQNWPRHYREFVPELCASRLSMQGRCSKSPVSCHHPRVRPHSYGGEAICLRSFGS